MKAFRFIMLLFIVVVALIFGIPYLKSDKSNTIFTATISPIQNELFLQADYSVYIPSDETQIKGIIVHQHGCGRNGLSIVYDYHWRRLAEEHHWALLGTHYIAGESCDSWNNPDNGSERAFFLALEMLGKKSGHKELITLPWVLWGHSGGALWSCQMLDKYPERVAGVFARSLAAEYDGAALKVPVFISPGAFENNHPQFNRVYTTCLDTYNRVREKNGFAALAVDPLTAHECGNSRLLAIPFFDACIKRFSAPDSYPPIEASLPEGIDTLGISLHSSVYVSSNIAAIADEYTKTGTVRDITPPEAPFDLVISEAGPRSIRISWKAKADIESGIKQFALYRDGIFLKEFVGYNDIYNAKNFQYGNFGDEPIPEALYENNQNWNPTLMEFYDFGLKIGKTHSYQLKMINWSGLESPLSEEKSILFILE